MEKLTMNDYVDKLQQKKVEAHNRYENEKLIHIIIGDLLYWD